MRKPRSGRQRIYGWINGVMALGMGLWFLTGCGKSADGITDEADALLRLGEEEKASGQQTGMVPVNASGIQMVSYVDMFTDRDMSGDYEEDTSVRIIFKGETVACDSETVRITEGHVTVTQEGVYLLEGSWQEGMLLVDAPDTAKVQLVLGGVEIFNGSNAALYVKSADKVFLTIAEGTVNKLESGGDYSDLDGNHIDGAVFAKCDLTINGTGSLEVGAVKGHGIVAKDDLKITGGNLTVKAAGHGLSGKDSVCIAQGRISLDSGKDGIHAEHDTNGEKGYVYIGGGSFVIDAEGDGVSSGNFMQIDGGDFVITTGGGSSNKVPNKNEEGDIVSTKGLKAMEAFVVNDGNFVIDAQDDALHSNDSLTVYGGVYQIATGDDGFHADEEMTVAGGHIDISTSYEGIEGNEVVISGGYVKLYASDDGINAAGGNDQSGFGGFPGGEGFDASGGSSLLISGGTIYVNADGDGLDSNGNLTVTGGEIYISGPVGNMDGALDYDGVGQITGGVVMAVGSVGMAMNFGETSTQGSALVVFCGQTAGSEIVVTDLEGKHLISYTAEKSYQSVVFSCPEMVSGGTYTISAGDSAQSVTLDGLIYGNGVGMGGFGGHGRGDRGNGRGPQEPGTKPLPEGMMPGEGQEPGMDWNPPGGQEPEMDWMPSEGREPGMDWNPPEGWEPGMDWNSSRGQEPEMDWTPSEGREPGMDWNPPGGQEPEMDWTPSEGQEPIDG